MPPLRIAGRSDIATTIGILAAIAYLLRDTFGVVWRWALDWVGIPQAWFIVDVIGCAALVAFTVECGLRRRSAFALYALALLPVSLLVAAGTVDASPAYLASATKMILPLYAGWLLAGVNLAAMPRVRAILLAACLLTMAGIWLDTVVVFPWQGFSVEQFGVTKAVDKVWTIQAVDRIGGFAGESTAAAAIAVFTYLMVHRSVRPLTALMLGIAVVVACYVTTSRTALAVASVTVAYVMTEAFLLARLRDHGAHRALAFGSLAIVVLPLALVALSSTIRFDTITPSLASFQQRIESSWQYPFLMLQDRSPASLLSGCGLGCMTFPMKYSAWSNWLQPVDNFHIVNFAMFGIGYLPLLVGMVVAAVREADRTKLMLLFALNLYTLSIEAFSPAFTLLAIGYATSGMCLVEIGSAGRADRRRFSPAA